MACGPSQGSSNWRQAVQALYPDVTKRAYFVPPVCFNRVPYVTRDVVVGQPVLVVDPSSQTPAPSSASTADLASLLLKAIASSAPLSDLLSLLMGTHPSSQTSATSSAPTADLASLLLKAIASPAPLPGQFMSKLLMGTHVFLSNLHVLDVESPCNPQPVALSPTPDILSPCRPKSHPSPPPASDYSMWPRDPNPTANLKKYQETDMRDDFAQQHVLFCLKALADDRQEVMFVMSQLEYRNYLSNDSSTKLPKPNRARDGDFDILIVHERYGILVGELKSVGIVQAMRRRRADSDEVATVAEDAGAAENYDTQTKKGAAKRDRGTNVTHAVLSEKVRKAITQLEISGGIVKDIISDIPAKLMVRKTLIMPYIATEQLQSVLAREPTLEQDLRRCLEVPVGKSSEELCLCADQMSDCACPWDVTSATMSQLAEWWERRMACTPDPHMSEDIYLEIVSRLAGPATTVPVHCVIPPRVEVRTVGEAVSEVGERVARVMLTPDQIRLVSSTQPRVCLTGPPGTGKTLLLVLKGLDWLQQGHNVHVVSVGLNELAVSSLIYHQLRKTEPSRSAQLFFHSFSLDTDETAVSTAVSTLAGKAVNGQLHVIIDEATFSYDKLCKRVSSLVKELLARVTELHVWAASLYHVHMPTDVFRLHEPLTLPLRCPPVIQREVQAGVNSATCLGFDGYSSDNLAAPSDGPTVQLLRHGGQAQGHNGQWPIECVKCGQEVARVLRELDIGVAAQFAKAAPKNVPTESPPRLQYRDVFVLTMSKELCDDRTDQTGKVMSQACGFVRGLRDSKVPVCVLDRKGTDMLKLERDVADMAVARTDRVIVADFDIVKGLERKVVVLLEGRPAPEVYTAFFYSIFPELFDRIRMMSRCMSQLIKVERDVQASSTPDQASSTPDQASSIPDQASSIPDHTSSTPDQASSIPDQASPIPHNASSIHDFELD